jgi:hypothetical protein
MALAKGDGCNFLREAWVLMLSLVVYVSGGHAGARCWDCWDCLVWASHLENTDCFWLRCC